MGLNYYRRPIRADLNDPNPFITESMADDENSETTHHAFTDYTIRYVTERQSEAEQRIKRLFGRGDDPYKPPHER